MATPPKGDAPLRPNVELRITQKFGDKEYKRLLEQKFALIIASLFQVMQEDGTSDRFLSKDPSLAATTTAHTRDIVEFSHSTGKIPDPRRPYFKVKAVLNAVHCLCGQLQYDAVGVVQYLLDQGKGYLPTRPAFVIRTFLSILASLRAFLSTATGQGNTQMQLSLNMAQSFRVWLGDYLTGRHSPDLNKSQNRLFQAIVESVMGFG